MFWKRWLSGFAPTWRRTLRQCATAFPALLIGCLAAILAQFANADQIHRFPTDTPTATKCDFLAGLPHDPALPVGVKGVLLGKIDVQKATQACEADQRAFPQSPRIISELCRTYEAAQWYPTAKSCFEKAAKLGSPVAMNGLGYLALGHGAPVDFPLARSWFSRAASLGLPLAISNLGTVSLNDPDSFDEEKARSLFEKAASLGEGAAMFALGDIYYEGLGVARDAGAAKGWYQKSVDAGFLQAAGRLTELDANAELERQYPQAQTAVDLLSSALACPVPMYEARGNAELDLTQYTGDARTFAIRLMTSRLGSRDLQQPSMKYGDITASDWVVDEIPGVLLACTGDAVPCIHVIRFCDQSTKYNAMAAIDLLLSLNQKPSRGNWTSTQAADFAHRIGLQKKKEQVGGWAALMTAEQVGLLAEQPNKKRRVIGPLALDARPQSESDNQICQIYRKQIFQRVMLKRRNPNAVHLDMKATVAFVLNDTGRVDYVSIYKASNCAECDQAAIHAVRQAAPFPSAPLGCTHNLLLVMEFPAKAQ